MQLQTVADDLPTRGAGHSSTGGSTGRTRGYTALGEITGARVDAQNFGSSLTRIPTVRNNDGTYHS